MDILLFNSETKTKEIFHPLHPKKVLMYTCGPTVYNFAHIGNFRTYVFEDLLKRMLKFFGYNVYQVMNITDVDDKTIKGALAEKVSLHTFTEKYTQAFFEDLLTLGIDKADKYPKATDYIPQMVEMIETLVGQQVAYVSSDHNVYFNIRKFDKYGRLSHLCLDELKEGASNRVNLDEYEREMASDFVLWKAYDPKRDGDIYWDSPFGKGRPGWHIECSAMAISLLGESIDIHCGGVDNIFPHHENEIAQSECVTKKRFVTYWLHAQHLVVDGKKMSKSLGNFFTLRDLLQKNFSGSVIRFALLQTHYRNKLNFTFQGLEAAKQSLLRLKDFIDRLKGIEQQDSEDIETLLNTTYDLFASAIADDLNISLSLATIFDLLRVMNGLMDENKIGVNAAKATLSLLQKFDAVLHILPFTTEQDFIPKEVFAALEERTQARKNKDFKLADFYRDTIEKMGYIIEDTKEGPKLKKQ
ncbi:MAG: cysteine--tRNA ligase [Chlamydiales bacterium]|nr:cysteine--tRNA ligase [Chlamydiales bacterium]